MIQNYKVCNQCSLELPFEEFGNSSRAKDGLRQPCKKCRNTIKPREIAKQFSNLKDQRFGKLYVLEYEFTKNGNKYWKVRCDCGKISTASTVQLNNGKRKTCGDYLCRSGANSPLYSGVGDISGAWFAGLKEGSVRKNKNIKVNISLEYLWNLFIQQEEKCALTGISISVKHHPNQGIIRTASLDRIDSNGDYEIGNVQWVHKDVNKMKWDFDNDYFVNICKKVARNKNNTIFYDDIILIPNKSIVKSRSECDTSITFKERKFILPIIPSNMKTVVDINTCKFLCENNMFYIMHRFDIDIIDFAEEMKDYFLSISVGVKDSDYQVVEKLLENNFSPEFITIDIANAYSDSASDMVKFIKKELPKTYVIAGNVATYDGVRFLEDSGADCIKVGIAGGSVCTTKYKTGFSVPMFSSILNCRSATKLPLIADGGIKYPADIAKALVAGADLIMAGNMFSGYDQSAGEIIEYNNELYKEYYGSASEFNKGKLNHVEGTRKLIPYKGDMGSLIQDLQESLRSSISYGGGKNIEDMKKLTSYEIKGY